MGLLDNESIPRRKMTLFFVIDTSGSMVGSKIGSVNDAIENVLPMIGEISDENPDAEINVAALEFSTGTHWLYDEPKEAKEFIWQKVEADGLTSLGEACEELNKKLSRNGGFMSSPSGCFAPANIQLSDGGPTDNFEGGLRSLQGNSWYKNAIKIAIAIGDDAEKAVLAEFTGTIESVITVNDKHTLKALIRKVSVRASEFQSHSKQSGDTTSSAEDDSDKIAQDAVTEIKQDASQNSPVSGGDSGAIDVSLDQDWGNW